MKRRRTRTGIMGPSDVSDSTEQNRRKSRQAFFRLGIRARVASNPKPKRDGFFDRVVFPAPFSSERNGRDKEKEQRTPSRGGPSAMPSPLHSRTRKAGQKEDEYNILIPSIFFCLSPAHSSFSSPMSLFFVRRKELALCHQGTQFLDGNASDDSVK